MLLSTQSTISLASSGLESRTDHTDKSINESGRLTLRSDYSPQHDALSMKTHASFEITGMTARVEVTQYFKNDSNEWVEGIYRFPLPQNSAVDHLTMIIGERKIEGEIQPKAKAKEIYQQAKNNGKKASLVEQLRPNMFTSKVANIAPNETIKIVIGYQQAVNYQAEEGFSLRFPLAITPRYTPLADSWGDRESGDSLANDMPYSKQSSDISPPLIKGAYRVQPPADDAVNQFSFDMKLHAGFALRGVESKGYPAFISQTDSTEYTANLSDRDVIANGDLLLQWQPIASSQPKAAVFQETTTEGNFVSIMVMPPQQQFERQLNMPRQIIFVIDTSGSMGGESIRQARNSLEGALNLLNSNDSFNIIEFDSSYSQLFRAPQAVTASNIAAAKAFVSSLSADGGTEMYPALEAALNQSTNPGLLKQIVFLTDGAIGNESQLFELIQNNLNDTRLFTVGIGSAPNTFFMQRAAEFGHGSHLYVNSVEHSGEQIEKLFRKISKPRMTQIQIKWPLNPGAEKSPNQSTVEMWPSRIPDLYSGEPVWLTAKVPGMTGSVQVSGRLANTQWQQSVSLQNNTNQAGISTLWAREKIGSILRAAGYSNLNDRQHDAVLDTAMTFHLVSPLTSLVAVDKTPARLQRQLKSQRIKENLPRGMNMKTLSMPSTGLNLEQQFLLGILFMLLSILWLKYETRRKYLTQQAKQNHSLL